MYVSTSVSTTTHKYNTFDLVGLPHNVGNQRVRSADVDYRILCANISAHIIAITFYMPLVYASIILWSYDIDSIYSQSIRVHPATSTSLHVSYIPKVMRRDQPRHISQKKKPANFSRIFPPRCAMIVRALSARLSGGCADTG